MEDCWQFVPLAEVPPTLWRNGGGSTRELLAIPPDAEWRVRISVADVVAAGPFSTFPGVERWFAVLDGEGVTLDVAGVPQQLGRGGAVLRFGGAEQVHCTPLGGPTRDLNLMAPPGKGTLERLDGLPRLVAVRASTLVGVYAHSAPASIGSSRVPPYHLAWRLFPGPGSILAAGRDGFLLAATP